MIQAAQMQLLLTPDVKVRAGEILLAGLPALRWLFQGSSHSSFQGPLQS